MDRANIRDCAKRKMPFTNTLDLYHMCMCDIFSFIMQSSVCYCLVTPITILVGDKNSGITRNLQKQSLAHVRGPKLLSMNGRDYRRSAIVDRSLLTADGVLCTLDSFGGLQFLVLDLACPGKERISQRHEVLPPNHGMSTMVMISD